MPSNAACHAVSFSRSSHTSNGSNSSSSSKRTSSRRLRNIWHRSPCHQLGRYSRQRAVAVSRLGATAAVRNGYTLPTHTYIGGIHRTSHIGSVNTTPHRARRATLHTQHFLAFGSTLSPRLSVPLNTNICLSFLAHHVSFALVMV